MSEGSPPGDANLRIEVHTTRFVYTLLYCVLGIMMCGSRKTTYHIPTRIISLRNTHCGLRGHTGTLTYCTVCGHRRSAALVAPCASCCPGTSAGAGARFGGAHRTPGVVTVNTPAPASCMESLSGVVKTLDAF